MLTRNSEVVLGAQSLAVDVGLPMVKRLSVVHWHSADRLTWHMHPCYEILLLGEGATTYEFKPNGVAELCGGQFLVVPPHMVHRGLNDVRKPALLCGIMLEAASHGSVCHTPFDDTDLILMEQQLASASLRPRKMSAGLQQLVKRLPGLISEFDPQSRLSVIRTRIKICEIIFEVVSQLDKFELVESVVTVEQAILLMREQLDRPMSISQLAKKVGCSRAKLFEVFKHSTGLTPNDFWQRLRIEQAYQAVMNSQESITSIALNYGFSSSQYFCTVFRKYYGISPRECRLRSTCQPLVQTPARS